MRSPPCPETVLALIPWYLDLDSDDRGFVEAHAAECASCRSEIEMIAGGPVPTTALPDGDRLFAKVLARIEAGDERGRLQTPSPPSARSASRVGRWARAAIVPLLLGVGALGGQLIGSRGEVGGATAHPLGGAGGEASPSRPLVVAEGEAGGAVLIEVVFRPGVEAVHIERSLRAVGGNIVSGPSPMGRFRVSLPARSDAVAVAAWMSDRSGGIASLAEPVTN